MRYFMVYAWGDCPFCLSTQELLTEKGEHHLMAYIDDSELLLNYFKDLYQWGTVPLILLCDSSKGEPTLIGGYTDLIKYLEG